ncbi:MAG: flagellar basal body rod protein FlgC [Planctomycetaceae bacterium]
MLRTIDISTSGLVAQRQRMNTIAGNIANVHTTRDADGNPRPFQRRMVTFSAAQDSSLSESRGVGVTFQVEVDPSTTPRQVYEPGHPDANAQGIVSYPGINIIHEFVNAMEASRAYEANVTVIEMSKEMASLGMRILG